jgi:hypothetical protein
MIGEKQRRFIGSAGLLVSPRVQTAIVQLAEAYDYAYQAQCNLWDFAVEIDALKAIGLSYDDLCWLVVNGYAKCGQEVTKRDDMVRKFHPLQDMKFTRKTCFIATNVALRLTTSEFAFTRQRRAA